MLNRRHMPCCDRFSVRYTSVGYVPVAVLCFIAFLTTLDAAALNRTGPAPSQVLPSNQLQPDRVHGTGQEAKVGQVSRLSLSVVLLILALGSAFNGQSCQLVTLCHPRLTYIFNFRHSGPLALSAECQSARMSEIKM